MEDALKRHLAQAGGCLALSSTIYTPYSWPQIEAAARNTGNSSASVFLCHCYHVQFRLLAKALQTQNVTGKTWIFTTHFAVALEVFTSEMLQLLNGSLALKIHSEKIPGFVEFLTTLHPAAYPHSHLMKLFWQKLFSCAWPNLDKKKAGQDRTPACTGAEEMDANHLLSFDLDNWAGTYQAYLATRAFIIACHSPVHLYVRNINFSTPSKEDVFFKNGAVPAALDIMNLQILSNGSLRGMKVGYFSSRPYLGKHLLIDNSTIVWARSPAQAPHSVCTESCLPGYRKLPLQGKASCCYDCQKCPNGQIANGTDSTHCWTCFPGQWPNDLQDQCLPTIFDFLSYTDALGTALAACSTFFFLLSLSILCIFIRHHRTPLVKANNHKLSYLLLASLALCFLCPLMFLGRPDLLTCSLRQAVFGLVFTVCLSAVLAKTVTVVMAFSASQPGSYIQKWIDYKLPGMITLCCPLVQGAICVFWVTKWPPFPSQNPLQGGAQVTLECDKGSLEFFYTMLGYLGLLATISLGVAFPAHQLPTAFNEAQHIAISMLVFTFVWVSFMPSYLSATGKYTVAVEIFAILASGAGLLACLFFPKCYIILLQPEKNNKGHLLGRFFPQK
ncbi:vomeronasal type-2 receptor 26-like [Eublepharis macularius]|uniref:Vomeronasal type-2 receptor 26-like n=1 Tax=Eublepharis macularius TaxID=481883 RepID=A0AA97KL19_EUBMA|nr:vomeronasal type-2 receptor 26-like [Eublepharis macularius]